MTASTAPDRRPQTDRTIHVVSEFANASGGTEWYALNLAAALRQVHDDVRCWADYGEPDAVFSARKGIEQIALPRRHRPASGHFPRRGHVILLGEWWLPGAWLRLGEISRITQVATIVWERDHAPVRAALLETGCPVDHVFVCDAQRRFYNLPGPVHPVPMSIDLFRPRAGAAPSDRFVVGRLSRDVVEKHDFVNDPPLYSALLSRGAGVRLMGATCIAPMLQRHPRMQVMPVRSESATDFLHSLDCFFFRTGTWYDTFATVLFEAMASGLPVVAHRWGGYSEYIRDGVNAFLFDTQDEALDILESLRKDMGLRKRMGSQARKAVEALYSPEAVRDRALHYLRPPLAPKAG